MRDLPIVVCLCGSRRFRAAYEQAVRSETLAGRLAISAGCAGEDNALDGPTRAMLAKLHLSSIDLADCILVVSDASGYIGESTRREIEYAMKTGKVVRWMHDAAKAVYAGQVETTFHPPDPKGDTRTWWQLASDECGKVNDRHREATGDLDTLNIASALTLTGIILHEAHEAGKWPVKPGPEMKTKEILHHAEELYGNHRTWTRGRLKALLDESLAEARKAHAAKEVQA